jgi:hypothetical protein
MSITELMKKAKASASKRTITERKKLLVDAKILDTHGNYDIKYFSQDTVNKSKSIARSA